MKFRFALFVGLLLATSVVAADDSSSTDASSTTQAADSASSTSVAAAASSSLAATSATDATTQTADPSATTPSPGPSTSAGPTVSGATAGPSSDSPVVTTPAGPTVSQGPTTTGPLPNVTYSLVQFGAPVCMDATCTYEINAPVNNQAVLATEQSIIATDRTKFGVLQSNASSVDADVKSVNDAALAKIAELQQLLDQIQANLNWIQNATKQIQSQQDTAKTNLIFVEKFIKDVNSSPSTCLYQRCLKPTTPAPPTTPTTPAPTTPPSPCVNYTCPGDNTGAIQCKLDANNKPYCLNCPGNYDAYNHCATISCSATANPIKTDDGTVSTWYSTGYNATGNSSIPAKSNCVWNLPSGPLKVTSADDFNFDCLKSQVVTITFANSDGVTQDVSSTTSMRVLNPLLIRMVNGTITLKSTAVEPTFCKIIFSPVTSSGMMLDGEMKEDKKNGFFSWLMGY